jgi:hypothetical protein
MITHTDTQIWGKNEDVVSFTAMSLGSVATCKAQPTHALCRLHSWTLPVGHKLAIHRSITDNGRPSSGNRVVSLNCCPVSPNNSSISRYKRQAL